MLALDQCWTISTLYFTKKSFLIIKHTMFIYNHQIISCLELKLDDPYEIILEM